MFHPCRAEHKMCLQKKVNKFRLKQNGKHFAGVIFKFIHFLVWKLLYVYSNFPKIYSKDIWCQAIIYTNADPSSTMQYIISRTQ